MKDRPSFKQLQTQALHLFLNDIKSAKWAIFVIIAYFVLSRKIFHSMCPIVIITGFPCPGCGLTRAGFALLSLDFAGAWRLHPFIYPLVLLAASFFFNRYFLGKQKMPFLEMCLALILVLMIIFYVWRMLRYFPGEPPMSYYNRNLLRKILHE